MNNKFKLFSISLFISYTLGAQVTKVGNDTLMDVACWNTEWFGDEDNGPGNEAVQYANVKTVLNNTDMDVWGLAEVSDPTVFNTLLAELPAYDGVESLFSQTQKTAMIWKKAKFDLISYGNVLTESSYSYNFAGRPPLEVILKTKGNAITDTLYFYVLHLKANRGNSDQASYDRRKAASGYIKAFLDQYRNGKKVLVIGDWNDDVDESVVRIGSSQLETPFKNFLNDSAHYFFVSQRLSLSRQKSYVYGSEMIDHQMISRALKDSFYVANSSEVMSQLSSQISGYGNNTSDHYPVFSRYNLKRYSKPIPVGIQDLQPAFAFSLYPNPANSFITIVASEKIIQAEVLNNIGETVIRTTETEIDIASLLGGIYFVKLTGENGLSIRKLVIHH